MNVALYARVSTADQDCSMQIDELRLYCKARGWEVAQEYVDTISGAKFSRPQRDRLMRDASPRRVDVVIVWKLDRWGRSLADDVVTLERLASAGVRFICTTQGLDTENANPVGRAMLGMLQVFAQFERDLINERVNSGIRRYQSEFIAGRAVSKSGKNLPIGRSFACRKNGKQPNDCRSLIQVRSKDLFSAQRPSLLNDKVRPGRRVLTNKPHTVGKRGSAENSLREVTPSVRAWWRIHSNRIVGDAASDGFGCNQADAE
jgi:DNA invertase Pin-like site-specific DNA recombinase